MGTATGPAASYASLAEAGQEPAESKCAQHSNEDLNLRYEDWPDLIARSQAFRGEGKIKIGNTRQKKDFMKRPSQRARMSNNTSQDLSTEETGNNELKKNALVSPEAESQVWFPFFEKLFKKYDI